MEMTPKDTTTHETAQNCHECEKPLNGDSVRDHCHIMDKNRGAAHNLKLRLSAAKTHILVVFNNLRGYDSHLIMQAISKEEGQVTCIPNNMEKYISFNLRSLRFIDSAQFLQASLDRLVSACPKEAFTITRTFQLNNTHLLIKKGVYPYEYMSSWGRFWETVLPPIKAFNSQLTGEGISEAEYQHALKVWETFSCQNLGDYHYLYFKTDVLLLADVFQNFRKTCQGQYGLDPAHYYTSPGLSWDAMLKKTGYDMYLFIEKGLGGGVSMVSQRYAKANNPHIEGYDPEKPTAHLMYYDANNLYGWGMSQPLATGGFEWVNIAMEEEIVHHPDDAENGYILEVDLEYPKELHDSHSAYPQAPEQMRVKDEWMSEYQQNLLREIGGSLETVKLVPNLRNKERHIVSLRGRPRPTIRALKDMIPRSQQHI
jgi:hypothetical protein